MFFHQNRTWMCLLDLEKSDYLYINFLKNFPPISIPFSKEKHPIWIKLGAFYNNLPKIHPIYVIWAPSSLMKTPPIAIPNFAKKCPKRQAHIRIPCQCENPPGTCLDWEGNRLAVFVCLFVCITDHSEWKHADGPDRTSLDKMPKHDFKKPLACWPKPL